MGVKLAGQYDLNKSNLLNQGLHLVIGTRRKPSPNKPRHFLLQKTGGNFIYLSSLYPFNQDAPEGSTDAQIFSFDWKGVYYLLTLKTGEKQAEIGILETGQGAAMPLQGGGAGLNP